MDQAINAFLKTWIEEFGRAVEMFTGSQPSIVETRVQVLPGSEAGPILWLKQIFAGSGSFTTWIGAPEATWTALGDTDPDNPQGIYQEILGQAQTGAATVASRGLDQPVSCQEAEVVPEADFEASTLAIFALEIDGGKVPDLLFAIELSAVLILDPESASDNGSDGTGQHAEASEPAMAGRLLDLELPVAVSLGHAELSIRKALAMKSGAVIELNKETGEDVELLVHGTVVARGEIALVKGNYGIRIKHIVGPGDRLTLLRN